VVDDIRPGRVLVPAVLLRDQEMMMRIIERAQIDQPDASSVFILKVCRYGDIIILIR
jgi:hypothetical protein